MYIIILLYMNIFIYANNLRLATRNTLRQLKITRHFARHISLPQSLIVFLDYPNRRQEVTYHIAVTRLTIIIM